MPAEFEGNSPLAKLEELKNEPAPNYGFSPITIIRDVSSLTNKDASQHCGTPNCRLCALGIKGHSYVAAIEIEQQFSPPRNEPKMEPKLEQLSISDFDPVVRVHVSGKPDNPSMQRQPNKNWKMENGRFVITKQRPRQREYQNTRNCKIRQKKEAQHMRMLKYNLSLTEEEKQKQRDKGRMKRDELKRAIACVPENIISGKRTSKGTENIKTHCLSLLKQEQVDEARQPNKNRKMENGRFVITKQRPRQRDYQNTRNCKIQQKKEAQHMRMLKYNLSLTEEEKQKQREKARMKRDELKRAIACVPENIITGKRTRKGTENIKTHCLSLLEQEQVDEARKKSIRNKKRLKVMTEEEKAMAKENECLRVAEWRRMLPPEKRALINQRERRRTAEWRRSLLPEQKAVLNEKKRINAAEWRQKLSQEELAVINERKRIKAAEWRQKLLREKPEEYRERRAAQARKHREKQNAARREKRRLRKLEEPQKCRELLRRKSQKQKNTDKREDKIWDTIENVCKFVDTSLS